MRPSRQKKLVHVAFKRQKETLVESHHQAVLEPPFDAPPSRSFGDVLVDSGLVKADDLAAALAHQNGHRLGEVLVEERRIHEDVVTWALAKQRGLDYIDLTKVTPDAAAIAVADPATARARQIAPLRIQEGRLDVVIGAMGYGDVRLAALCGLVLGWHGFDYLALGLYGSFVLGAAVGVALIAAKRAKLGRAIPFAPYLSAATIATVLYGGGAADVLRRLFGAE